MNEKEINREIKKTLKDIFEYMGINPKDWPENATLQYYLEQLISRCCI
jgi:hypothetical protein